MLAINLDMEGFLEFTSLQCMVFGRMNPSYFHFLLSSYLLLKHQSKHAFLTIALSGSFSCSNASVKMIVLPLVYWLLSYHLGIFNFKFFAFHK